MQRALVWLESKAYHRPKTCKHAPSHISVDFGHTGMALVSFMEVHSAFEPARELQASAVEDLKRDIAPSHCRVSYVMVGKASIHVSTALLSEDALYKEIRGHIRAKVGKVLVREAQANEANSSYERIVLGSMDSECVRCSP